MHKQRMSKPNIRLGVAVLVPHSGRTASPAGWAKTEKAEEPAEQKGDDDERPTGTRQ